MPAAGARLLAILVCAAPALLSQAPATVPFYGEIIGSGASGRTLYATTGPGYFNSIDDGATWNPVYVSEAGAAQPPFAAFAVDPLHDSTLYLATSPDEGALWKSTDAGLTWQKANAGLPASGPVTQTYLLIANNRALYLRLDTALYKSQDGGVSWVKLAAPLPGNARAFDINRGTPAQMFYGGGSAVWKSTDEGASWRAVASLATGLSGIGCVVTEPSFPDVVYVCVAGGGNPAVNGVYVSANGGSSFNPPTSASQPIRMLTDHVGGGALYTAGSTGTICRSQSRGTTFTCIPATAFVPPVNPTSTVPRYVERRNANIFHITATVGTARTPAMYRTLDAGQTFRPLEGLARVTFAKAAIAIATAPEVTASAPLSIAAVDLPAAAIPFTATASGEPWFTVNQTSGQTPASLTVTFRSEGLPPGARHEGTIRIESPRAETIIIPVTLEVTKPVLAPAPVYSFTALAGNGEAQMGADGALAAEASIGDVSALAVDRDRNVFFLATTHNRIRQVSAAGLLSTVVGSGSAGSAPDGTALLQAPLNRPESLAFDSKGVLYFGEASGVVRRIANGVLGTLLRAGQVNTVGATLLAVDPQDRVWLGNQGRFFRNALPSPELLTLLPAGTSFRGAGGMAFDAQGNLYVTPTGTLRIYKITPAGVVSVFAGNGTSTISEGVPALATGMESPTALATDARGNVLYVESRQAAIRLINPAGIVYTIAKREGEFPRQIATDSDSNVYATGFRALYKYTAPPLVIPTPAGPARNLASGEPSLSPGALFVLDGENLALGDETIPLNQPWPSALAGSAVTVNGVAALLSHASPGRITGQIPPGLEPGLAKLVVKVNGVSSPEWEVPLALASPGIFTVPDDPDQAAADAEFSEGTAVISVTGYGPAETDGFKVVFDDQEIDGLEIVPAPGLVGVGRARFALPEGVLPGSSHTVRIAIGDAASNTVRITVPE
ncbi:MAG: hypothetical protein IT162_14490 [Bryobacterales bacterium]|nr:hypothetical protein [Bryobacterales bacterium]